MIHDQVHTTCTVNTETQLLLAPSLSATETWVQDTELELTLSRYVSIISISQNTKLGCNMYHL